MLTVHDFVDITENKLGKPVEDVVKMAKRHNNPKRDFLFVNTLLGKHIAVSGVEAIEMHQSLGDEVYQLFLRKGWADKKVLLVGFAETATALAQSIMYYALRQKEKFPLNIVAYIQTTREKIAKNDFINISFEEEHSHATTQKLYFDPTLDYDVVLFVEDEITTGNTILNFITQFEKYQAGKQYAVASILNWQNNADEQKFVEKGVETAYLVRGKIKEELPQFSISEGYTLDLFDKDTQYELELSATNNPRLPMTMSEFEKYEYFGNIEGKILKKILATRPSEAKVLVIGTEENMFLPMRLAEILKADVKATTRSPIEPSFEDDYPISFRTVLNSVYEGGRTTYLYNMEFGDLRKYRQFVLFIEEENSFYEKMMKEYLSPYGEVVIVKQKGLLKMENNKLVQSSYSKEEVTILLQDVQGKVPVLDTKEREKLNQSGVHYSEMLPVEYAPSDEYLKLYKETLASQGKETAQAVVNLASKILKEKSLDNIVLVSLARAGTPVGILLKRYFDKYADVNHKHDIPHYTISIIRGKGFDKAAINYILDNHPASSIVFVDGWVGKGAINRVLAEAVAELGVEGLSPELAVLSDPASETKLYGTRNDFLIPSACLNSTVSGLISRTVHLPTMSDDEFHGAVYYEENEAHDLSNDFLDEIESYFPSLSVTEEPLFNTMNEEFKGIDEVKVIASEFEIDDINKVKPGLGETIRVLLRRVPEVVLIRKDAKAEFIAPIIQLAKEKGVPVKKYPLKKYNACGIIKDLSDL